MLSQREQTDWLLRALAMWARVLTAPQVARWFGIDVPAATKLLRQLVRSRLVLEQRAVAQFLPAPLEPLYRHEIGQPLPAPGPLSWRAKKRFRDVEMQNVSIYSAAPKTVNLFGLPSRDAPKAEHATHDIICGEMFLYAIDRWPLLTCACYQMEDVYAHERVKYEKLEDARFYRAGQTLCVCESIGRYSKARMQDFLDEMAYRDIPYFLLW